jgi:MFS family permease
VKRQTPERREAPDARAALIGGTIVPAIVTARTRWLGLVVLLAGALLPPIDYFIVNVALPSIRESLHTSPAETQLVISGYAAGYAVFLITGGRLGDLFGRRLLYIVGMTGFALANLLCGIAQTPTQLLLGRVAIGITAAMLQPQTLATLRALHTEERELARVMSLYGTMVGLAAAVGQFAGGALVPGIRSTGAGGRCSCSSCRSASPPSSPPSFFCRRPAAASGSSWTSAARPCCRALWLAWCCPCPSGGIRAGQSGCSSLWVARRC